MTYEGNCRLGDLFTSRREKGRAGLPTLSVTMNDGLVDRDDLDRKQETNLAPEEHLLVKPGDIAYNMMRMWQGAFGLADREGLVSPAYVVLKPNVRIDPLYASYLFKSPRIMYLFWAYSYGLTDDRLRLYFQDFAKIPVNVPTKSVQEQMANMLSTWERAVIVAEKLQKTNEQVRRGLVHELVLGKKRLPKHTGKWRNVKLGDVADIVVSSVDKRQGSGEQSIVLCNYTQVYYNRYLTCGVKFDSGTASASEILRFGLRKGDLVITKDSEQADDIGVSAFVKENIRNLVCGYHLAIIRPKEDLVDGVFLNSLFALHKVRRHFAIHANGVTRFGLPIKAIESLSIKLPPLAEQRDLANLILHLDEMSALSVKKVQVLAKEMQALSQRLVRATGSEHALRMAIEGGR